MTTRRLFSARARRWLWLLPLLAAGRLDAADAVRAGELIVERPTLICLGFEWKISGDDNRNSSVALSYRKSGESPWKQAMPLLRMGGERVFRTDLGLDYTVPHGFAGSIVDLEPDTEYEARLELRDPDGAEGELIRTVKVRTRGEPRAAEGGRVLHVYPPQWEGPKQEPSFIGLKSAYYGSGRGDWAVVSERKAQPGDVILVHAGLYKSDRLNYSDPLGLPFDGTYALSLKATADKPIVIRAAGDGEAIFDGDGVHHLFDVMGSAHHIFEGLTVRNTDVAFYAGRKEIGGAVGLTVRNCRFEDIGVAGDRVRRLARFLHRRQRDARPRRPLPPGGLVQPRHLWPAPAQELLRRQGLRLRTRGRPQLCRLLP